MVKLIPQSRIAALAQKLKKQGKRIVFTNGTFDILHAGHVRYLQKAKVCGDILIIGVNTDASVKVYKDPNRPVNHQKDRVEVLSALACVDYLVLFNEPTPLKLIKKIRPHVLAKGADWKKSQIAGAAEVESWGGKVKRIQLVTGRSTTNVISKILKSQKKKP